MKAKQQTIEVSRFASGVAAGWCAWDDALGQKINHARFGSGVIKATVQSGDDRIVTVRFDDGDKQLNGSFFGGSFFSTMTLPTDIYNRISAAEGRRADGERKRTEERELSDQLHAEFADLLEELWQDLSMPAAAGYDEGILEQLRVVHAGGELSPEALAALGARFGTVIEVLYHERRATRSGDRSGLIQAARYWAHSGEYLRLLSITEPAPEDSADLAAALLQVRAAAYRELDQLDDAVGSAQSAHELNPADPQPLLLLGACSYERRQFPAGDAYFKAAEELGAASAETVEQIAGAARRMSAAHRRSLLNHLTKRDPARVAEVKSRL